jgi:DNA repair protein REV1
LKLFQKPDEDRTDKPEGIWEGYALHDSNPHAKEAMKSAEWRQAHTSVSDSFIKGYYQNSRLHYLSMWKMELKNIVAQAQDSQEKAAEQAAKLPIPLPVKATETIPKAWSMLKGKGKAGEEKKKVIMHCDFDSFFVAAGLVERPHLKGKPVVVCHSQGRQGGGASTSEVASASYEARQFGIKNGMRLVLLSTPL